MCWANGSFKIHSMSLLFGALRMPPSCIRQLVFRVASCSKKTAYFLCAHRWGKGCSFTAHGREREQEVGRKALSCSERERARTHTHTHTHALHPHIYRQSISLYYFFLPYSKIAETEIRFRLTSPSTKGHNEAPAVSVKSYILLSMVEFFFSNFSIMFFSEIMRLDASI